MNFYCDSPQSIKQVFIRSMNEGDIKEGNEMKKNIGDLLLRP